MKHYNYLLQLEELWKKAVGLYQDGNQSVDDYFDTSELSFLRSIGISAQEMFDYAEDFVSQQEPTFSTVATEVDARRNYFREIQKEQPSDQVLDPASLPPKDSSVEGIDWLPRIIPKAKAKLRGELHPSIMYGCGGDRRFFKKNDIHPAEFLRVVWAHEDDDAKIIEWVKERTAVLQS